MDPRVEPLVNGLRAGSLVEIQGLPEGQDAHLNGQQGQLQAYVREADKVQIVLLSGEQASVDPAYVIVPQDLKKPGCGGSPASFDILLGPLTPDALLAEELAACIFEKGFCVLRLCQSLAGLEKTVEAVRALGDEGRLGRLPHEVEEGYLGTGGRGKVLWMDRDAADCIQDEVLDSNEQTLSHLASLFQPFSADAVGKFIDERTPALVSLSLTDEEEDDYPQPMADDKTLGDFLGTWRRGALRAVQFMGPPVADVALENRGGEQASALPCLQERVEIQAPPNTILLFRADCYTYECRAAEEVLTMMVSFLAPGPQFFITAVDGDPNALRGLAEGPRPPAGEVVNVKHHHTRLAARWDDSEMFNTGLQAGTDTVVEIPFVRFDVGIYWCPDPSELLSGPPRSVQRHTSFVDGIDLFDFKYFEISKSEATGMDPLQRQVLDVGGNLLHMLGISKKVSNRTAHHGGCAVGLDKDDYPNLPNAVQGSCNALAIIANRFSFVFNMKGPNFVCDTACSASLTATHIAKMMLLERTWDPLEFHLALGAHLCLSPGPWIGCSYAQMVSPEGRCFTFNSSANGYLRGEGTSGVLLKYGADDEKDAILRASAVGQDGRSASLTAPNGPAQEEMVVRALREARMAPSESTCWECHGTGTSLGDPIEVGAVRRVQVKAPRQEPLMMSTAKSNIGHLEGGAAMGGIVKCVLQVRGAQAFTSLHVRQLNPHLESAAFDAFYMTELVAFRHEQGHAQVSSFGFGGSNGHAVFWGRRLGELLDLPQQVLRRLARMKPPEVRPIGDDPEDWEADLPDADAKPGDRWLISFSPDDPPDAPIKWVKDYSADGMEEGEDASFSITGNFNGWAEEPMAAGGAPGQSIAAVAVPASGVLEFHFLKEGDPQQVVCPAVPDCTRKSAPIVGPTKEVKHNWVVRAEPNTQLQIELIAVSGKYSVLWLKV